MSWRQIGFGIGKYCSRPIFANENTTLFSIGGITSELCEEQFNELFDKGYIQINDMSFAEKYSTNRKFPEIRTSK